MTASIKEYCRAATVGDVTLSGLSTPVDGLTLVANDRVLVRVQDDPTENGIWLAASGAWTRAADFDATGEAVGGALVSVRSGSTAKGSVWRLAGSGTPVIGTDEIEFEPAIFGSLMGQDELNGQFLDIMRFIPYGRRADIIDGTSYSGAFDASPYVNVALQEAAVTGRVLRLHQGYGHMVIEDNLLVPVGRNGLTGMIGGDWTLSKFFFDGTGVDKGIFLDGGVSTGVNAEYGGTLQGFRVECRSGAKRAVTISNINHPRLVRLWLRDAEESALVLYDTIEARIDHVSVSGSGDADHPQVDIGTEAAFNDTTLLAHQLRIGAGHEGCVAGIDINKLNGGTFEVCAVESTGVPVRIGNASDAAVGVGKLTFINQNIENPTTCYYEVGQGLSGDAYVNELSLLNCINYLSGATGIASGMKAKRTVSLRAQGTYFGLNAAGGAHFNLEGTANIGAEIGGSRAATGGSHPWVLENGTQRFDAGPRGPWLQDYPRPCRYGSATISGTAGAGLIETAGGLNELYRPSNGSATTMTTLTYGGVSGPVIGLRATNGNTTLQHQSSFLLDGFKLLGAANVTMVQDKEYRFRYDAGMWREF